jgi:molybdate transport system substrate-binding protein
MIPRRAALPVIAGLALMVSACAPPATAPLTVLAAASLKEVMDAQAVAFAESGGLPVRFSYAASSALARQVESGAPADIFISADMRWMDHVAQRGLIRNGSRRDLATNRLALIAPRDSAVSLTMEPGMPLAATLGEGRLAIAEPEVPAGRYGRAALESLGVWPSVQDRLAPADNVRGALRFVSQGEAPLGIVYDSDARSDPSVRIVALFPQNSHPRIVYPGAVLRDARHPEAARFLDFLRTPKAAQIFLSHGFTPL